MFGLFGKKIRITKERYKEIGGDASFYIWKLVEANKRVDTYLASAIKMQPTTVQKARSLKLKLPNESGVQESARKLDEELELHGSLTSKFEQLLKAADNLRSAGFDDSCIEHYTTLKSRLTAVERTMNKIERTHIETDS